MNEAEQKFQNDIQEIVKNRDLSTEENRAIAQKEINTYLIGINKINVGKDIVGHVFIDALTKETHVEIFDRVERVTRVEEEIARLKMSQPVDDSRINELRQYLDVINRIGYF